MNIRVKNINKKENALVRMQNKVRGALSLLNSTSYEKGRSRTSYSFRRALTNLLLTARSELDENQAIKFFGWLKKDVLDTAPNLAREDITHYDYLAGVITDAPTIPIAKELFWISERIHTFHGEINDFLDHKVNIERLIFEGKALEALVLIEEFQTKYGVSLWSVQIRLAVEQAAGGLEGLKKYSNDVRSRYKNGLLPTIAYVTGVRNETRTTIDQFNIDMRERIDRNPHYDDSIRIYLRYKLLGEEALCVESISSILRVEQSHSLIDVYETFIWVAQLIVGHDELAELKAPLLKALIKMGSVHDFRICKCLVYLGQKDRANTLSERNTKVSDLLLSGNQIGAAKAYRLTKCYIQKIDPWLTIYAAYSFNKEKRKRTYNFELKNICFLLANCLNFENLSIDSFNELEKLTLNYSGLPSIAGVRSFIKLIRMSSPDFKLDYTKIGLNSRYIGVEDFKVESDSEKHLELLRESITKDSWLNSNIEQPSTEIDKYSQARKLFLALNACSRGDFRFSLENISKLEELNAYFSNDIFLQQAKLSAYFWLEKRNLVIELIAKIGSSVEAARKTLPIVQMLKGYTWQDFEAVNERLRSFNAMHLLWSITDSKETASLLRGVLRQYFRSGAIDRPSGMEPKTTVYTNEEWIYFYSYVCTSQFIDQLKCLKGTRAVMAERQSICAILRQIDRGNSSKYETEITLLTHQQVLEDGQWVVNRTRIHVDASSLARWADKNLSEGFSRYKEIRKIDSEMKLPVAMDLVLRNIMSGKIPDGMGGTSHSESDIVLIELISKISEEFLSNSSFGLDYYLSKRIRHQSFVGLIRGPVENHKLITTRESISSQYKSNTYWLEKLNHTSRLAAPELDAALSNFSSRFDNNLIVAKNSRFQIRSAEYPQGLIFIELLPQHIYLIKAVCDSDTSVTDFTNTVIAVLWAALEPSLEKARRYIRDELKIEMLQAFESLKADVRKKLISDDILLSELLRVAGECSALVQRELDEAAEWFVKAGNTKDIQNAFSLSQLLDISLETVLRCLGSFTPKISKVVVDDDIRVFTDTLVFVHDVLFVALDNAKEYSNLRQPNIKISLNVDSNNETLQISVIAECKAENKDETEKKLTEIRSLISVRNFERRTKKEGGSGLLKLAAEALQNPKGSIEFGFNDSGHFNLTVTYSLILQKIDLELNEDEEKSIDC